MNVKRIVGTIIAASILLILAWIFLVQARIVAETTEDNATITIINNAGKVIEQKTTKKLVERLNSGTYTVIISRENSATKQSIDLKWRQTARISLGLVPAKEPALVANALAESINMQSDQLIYLDGVANKLFVIADGAERPIPYINTPNLISASWIDGTHAILQNNETHSFFLAGRALGDITQIPDVEDPPEVASIAVDVTAKNYAFVLDNEVFLSRKLAVPQRVMTVEKAKPQIALAANQLAAWYFPAGFPENTTPEPSYIYDLDTGSRTTVVEDKLIMDMAWAEAGKLLAYQTPEFIYVFDPSTEMVVDQISKSLGDKVPLMWLGDEAFIFGDNDGIWRYDLLSSTAVKLVTIRSGGEGFLIARREGTEEIFFTNNEARDNPAVYKFSLTAEQPEQHIRLTRALPIRADGYSVELFNISAPTIIITTYASPLNKSAAEFQEQVNSLRNDALTKLQNEGINTSEFKIHYLQSRYRPY